MSDIDFYEFLMKRANDWAEHVKGSFSSPDLYIRIFEDYWQEYQTQKKMEE